MTFPYEVHIFDTHLTGSNLFSFESQNCTGTKFYEYRNKLERKSTLTL
jgi:hypothetical protein